MTAIANFSWTAEYLTSTTAFDPGEIIQVLSPDPNSSTGDSSMDMTRLAAGASARASTSTRSRVKQPDLPGFPRAGEDPVHPLVYLGHECISPRRDNPNGLETFILKSLPMPGFDQLAVPAHLPDFNASADLIGIAPGTLVGDLQVPLAKDLSYQRPPSVINHAGHPHRDRNEPFVRLETEAGSVRLACESYITVRPTITRAVVNNPQYSLKVRCVPAFDLTLPFFHYLSLSRSSEPTLEPA